MNRILTALVASVAFLTLSVPSFASTTTSAPAPKVTPAGNHTCPKGSTYVKGYTKSDGTKVKGYCRTAAAPKPAATK